MKQKVLNAYDWFLIIGVIITNAAYTLLTGNLDIVGSLAGIAGVLCVVLVAKGSIWNYVFGLVNVSMYAYISYKASLYGDAVLNAFYYLPMQLSDGGNGAKGERRYQNHIQMETEFWLRPVACPAGSAFFYQSDAWLL